MYCQVAQWKSDYKQEHSPTSQDCGDVTKPGASSVENPVEHQSLESSFVHFLANQRGTIPTTPKAQSINRQGIGMPRTSPKINAHGMTRMQAIIPNSKIQIFRTGSRRGPMNATAIAIWPKASQSNPWAMNG